MPNIYILDAQKGLETYTDLFILHLLDREIEIAIIGLYM